MKLWQKLCHEQRIALENALKLKLSKLKNTDDNIRCVADKFLGNAGEILAEALFKAGLFSDIIDGSTYEPVDPQHERFIDATADSASDGLPIGIQVKNYICTKVKKETFDKLSAEDSKWLREDKRIPEDKIQLFLASPHMMIFSMTEAENDLSVDSSRNSVMFIGPKDIDRLHLQGSAVNRKSLTRWKLFNDIAAEI